MPNLQGGKKYKSSKHSQDARKVDFHEIDEGQSIGRVIRMLGNRRVLIYCNDNEQRICLIRGALRKSTWIQVGDIVLYSLRDIGGAHASTDANDERGDILAKYDPSLYGKLKKEYNPNPKLFVSLETNGAAKTSSDRLDENGDVDLFEREGEESDEEEEEGHVSKPKSIDRNRDLRTAAVADDDVDIDNI